MILPPLVFPGSGPISVSLEGVTMHAGHEVLMEGDATSVLIVTDLLGILRQQLRPRPILLLNISRSDF